ncbi:hypothetical protein [Novosphingobium sp.]|uniref:hypothetical protein n=1 Tax=Novosphingobium sp. TaxID=1874826 RepID=UPI0025CC9177|nr:hypothetical protein [Novosphingobium sp.]
MSSRIAAALTLILLLAACGSGGGANSVKSAGSLAAPAKTVVRTPLRHPVGTPRLQVIPGLEGLIGATSAQLVRQFGAARLDVIEGDARKLQFTGSACVLDVYLYPAAPGAEPTATYVDARRASDGQDVDRAACVGAMLHSRAGPPPPVKQG